MIGAAQKNERADRGRIAQLGERGPYKAEVAGSIPAPPTLYDADLPNQQPALDANPLSVASSRHRSDRGAER